jgi:acetylglutamate kinase
VTPARPVVLKLGGELLEDLVRVALLAEAVGRIASSSQVVIVHGGGKAIDAALHRVGIPKRQVDGLRITDEPSLDVVVAVLAGTINTRVCAVLNSAGVRAVGLTGADGYIGLVSAAPPHHSVDGRTVDLGCVGIPRQDGDATLIHVLLGNGFVPVVACIGADASGALFNVNADTLAGSLAARLRARRLVIAGTTPGVLDAAGRTIAAADASQVRQFVKSGTATAGMIAKLHACEDALAGGVDDVVIVDGRKAAALENAALGAAPNGTTRLVRTAGGVRRADGADAAVGEAAASCSITNASSAADARTSRRQRQQLR